MRHRNKPKPYYYILEGHETVGEPDVDKWMEWFMTHGHVPVAVSQVESCLVVTVFTGTNDAFEDDDPPRLFETTVFDPEGPGDEFAIEGWSTWEEAEAGHRNVMKDVGKSLDERREFDAYLEELQAMGYYDFPEGHPERYRIDAEVRGRRKAAP